MGTQYTGTVLGDTPTNYWKLNEASGLTIHDSASFGSPDNGTATNVGITYAQAGAIVSDSTTSLLFNGTSGMITLPSILSVAGLTGFSVEGWFNLSNVTFTNAPRIIADNWTGFANKGFEVQLGNSGSNIGFYVGNGTSVSSALWVTSLTANTWFHFVGTYDGANVRMYVNGVLRATTALTGAMVAGAGPWTIANLVADIRWFPGKLDELAVYTYAISGAQVLAHYNAGIAKNTSIYYVPTNTRTRVIQPEDINQAINVLNQPTGGQEFGHYFLEMPGYVVNATCSYYMTSLSRGATPVSVTVDAADFANIGYTVSPPNTSSVTANGFQIFDFCVTGPQSNPRIGGNYTINF